MTHSAKWAQEPARDSTRLFSLPKHLGGVDNLRELVSDYGGLSAVATDFRIGADLLNRYLSGQIEAPYSLHCALWWQTTGGFQQGFAESHWTHQFNSFSRKQAEAKVVQLETVVKHAIRLLEHRQDAADLVRQSLALAESGKPLLPIPLHP